MLAQNPYVKRRGEKNLSLQVEELQSQLSTPEAQSDLTLIAGHYGEPVWSMAVEKDVPNSGAHIYLPFITANSDRVEAVVMAVYDSDQTAYRLQFIDRGRIERYPLKEKTNELQSRLSRQMVGLIFTQVETQLFGSPQCDLVAILNQVDPLAKDCYWKYVETTTCYHYEAGGYHGADCVVDYSWEFVGCGGSPNTTGGLFSGGGGGWTGGSDGDGTTDPDRDPCLEDGRDCPEKEEEEDQTVLLLPLRDSIIDLTTDPCVDAVLNAFNGLGGRLATLLQDLFGASEYVNIFVRYSTPSDDIGTASGQFYGGMSGSFFEGNIVLNQFNGTSGCTQDYLLATIVHELLHGYIEYQFNTMDRIEFISRYNHYFGALTSSTTVQEIYEHITISEYFVYQFAQLLNEFNLDLSSHESLALAWGGLQSTPAWQEFEDNNPTLANEYLLINQAARCQPADGYSGTHKFVDC